MQKGEAIKKYKIKLLLLAVISNNLNITNILINAGSNLNIQTNVFSNQWTALHIGIQIII